MAILPGTGSAFGSGGIGNTFSNLGIPGLDATGTYIPGGGVGASPLPAKSTDTASTSGTRNTNSTTAGSSITTDKSRSKTKKKNIDDDSMAVLQNLIQTLAQNQDPVLSAIDQSKVRGLGTNEQVDQGLDPNDAANRAQGRVQEQTRRLLEQVLPEIYGGAENAGTGQNALADLLTQDAAVRTGEASARVMEEATSNAINQRIQNQNALTNLLAGGSATTDAMMQALGIAKGAIEDTDSTKVGESIKNSVSNTIGTETSEGTTTTDRELVDPLEWAKLQAQLQQIGGNQPSSQEKALALFQAMREPWMTSASLNPNFRASGVNARENQDATRGLLDFIRSSI